MSRMRCWCWSLWCRGGCRRCTGCARPEVRPLPTVVLGLIGAVLVTTYYYYLFVCVVVAPIYLVVEHRYGRLSWSQVRRAALVVAVAVAGSAPWWAPLLYDM